MTAAIMIPWDSTLPVQLIDLPGDPSGDDWRQALRVAVFNQQPELITHGTIGYQTIVFGAGGYFDDEGLFTQPANVNIRVMKLYAHLAGRSLSDFRQTLNGNWVIVGVDPYEGAAVDVPNTVRDYFAEEGIPLG